MSDRLGMIRAIQEQPGDDLPRLAYADWLEERGECEHAEFIRVEVRLSRISKQADEWRPLFAREIELILAGKDEWFGTKRQHWIYDMRRGFIEEISTSVPDSVVPLLDWLYDHHALQDLCVFGTWPAIRPLLTHPITGFLARLVLSGRGGYSPATIASMTASHAPFRRDQPLESRPLAISLAGHGAGVELVEALLESDSLERVSWLDLSENALGVEGVRLLFRPKDRFPRLTTLRLCGPGLPPPSGPPPSVEQTLALLAQAQNAAPSDAAPVNVPVVPNIGPEAIRVLASEPWVARLTRLDLEANSIDPEGVDALIRSPFLDKIEHLGVGSGVGEEGVRRLQERFGGAVSATK